jgi:hypothetical protein
MASPVSANRHPDLAEQPKHPGVGESELQLADRKAVKEYRVHESQLLRMLDSLSFYLCTHLSFVLSGNVFIGAVSFMAGFGIEHFYRLYLRRDYFRRKRLILPLLFLISIVLPLAGIFAAMGQVKGLPVILAVVLLLTLRSAFTHRIILLSAASLNRGLCFMFTGQALLLAALTVLLGLTVGWSYSLRTAAAAAVYPVFVLLWLFRSRGQKLVEGTGSTAGSAASFRLYHALLLCSYIALYLSMMMYAGMFTFMPLQGGRIPTVVLWIVLVSTIILVSGRLVKRGIIKKMEKTKLFIIGATISLLAHYQLNQSYTQFNPPMAWFWSMMQAVGLAVMLLLATYMQEDMRLVLELTADADKASDRAFRSMTQTVAFITAGMIICCEMYFMNAAIRSDLPEWDISLLRGRFMWLANFLPQGFILLSIVFALRQPLNLDMVRKLQLYCQQKISQSIIPEFENKLKNLLVRRYRKRIGIKIVALMLRPWFRHRVVGAEKVQCGREPVIFVANHGEVYGPIVTYLHLPFSFRPWIENKMLDRVQINQYLWVNTFSKMKPAWLGRFILKLAGPFLAWLLNSAEPIPVFRGEVKALLKTVNLSVLALQEQDNLLLFPEDPTKSADGHYALAGVSPFYTGFVNVARYYYRKTGKAITFYPVYMNQANRTLTFGDGVQYDPLGRNESDRVSSSLMASMNQMAGVPG